MCRREAQCLNLHGGVQVGGYSWETQWKEFQAQIQIQLPLLAQQTSVSRTGWVFVMEPVVFTDVHGRIVISPAAFGMHLFCAICLHFSAVFFQVYGIHDDVQDGSQPATITLSLESGDPRWTDSGLTFSDIAVTVQDIDVSGASAPL